MEWEQLLTIISVYAGIWLWSRAETKADWRRMDFENKALRRDLSNTIVTIHNDIRNEMRDFHGRLCTIEERRLKKR